MDASGEAGRRVWRDADLRRANGHPWGSPPNGPISCAHGGTRRAAPYSFRPDDYAAQRASDTACSTVGSRGLCDGRGNGGAWSRSGHGLHSRDPKSEEPKSELLSLIPTSFSIFFF